MVPPAGGEAEPAGLEAAGLDTGFPSLEGGAGVGAGAGAGVGAPPLGAPALGDSSLPNR